MSDVNEIAQKLIPCTCGGYGQDNRRHMTDCPRHAIAWEDIAAALAAERENQKAVLTHALVALEESHREQITAERAKFAAFAGPDGEPRPHCLNCGAWWDRIGRCPLCMNTHASTTSALAAAKEQP